LALFRRFFTRVMAPRGIYEYVIARTRYIDAAFRQALADKIKTSFKMDMSVLSVANANESIICERGKRTSAD